MIIFQLLSVAGRKLLITGMGCPIFCAIYFIICLQSSSSLAQLHVPPQQIDCAVVDSKHVLWRAHAGSQIGTMIEFEDSLIVGTNSDAPTSAVRPDEAVLKCFSTTTGAMRWRISNSRLGSRVNDLPGSPIASKPSIDEGNVYYVSNRGELCCVRLTDGTQRWSINMLRDLGVFKRDPSDASILIPSPLVVGNVVYCITGNGRDSLRDPVPRPNAPSFIAVDKNTGVLKWTNNDPGRDIIYGQWSMPAKAQTKRGVEILFPGGDGFLYSLDPLSGATLWKIDCEADKRGESKSFIVAPPVVDGDMVYVSLNRDAEQGYGIPHDLLGISLSTREIRWRFRDPAFDGTLGELAVDKDRIYAVGQSGTLVALEKVSGKLLWRMLLPDIAEGGLCVRADRIWVAAGSTVSCINSAGVPLVEYSFGGPIGGTPVLMGNKMFVSVQGDVVCVDATRFGG